MKEFLSVFWNSPTAKSCLLTLALLLVGAGEAFAQQTVRGTVTDESGAPLVGVSVVVESTGRGAVTDAQGNYAIDVPKQGTLVFSFIGMLPYQTTVGGGVTKIDVTLKEDVARLDEVVVIGYGNQRRADVTAVSYTHLRAHET